MTKPQHTFAILAYKESKYLEACIQSVLGQTIESRVLIATSTPNVYISSLAEKYRLPVFINNSGGSIGKDWNFGLSCADTDYVTITHQDDLYLPTFAEEAVNAFNKNDSSRPLIVFTRSEGYLDDRKIGFYFKNVIRWWLILPFHFKQCIRSGFWRKSILLFSNSISCPGVVYAKKHLPSFTFNETDKYILDWRAWYDLACMQGSFIYINKALHAHREHKESATSTTQLSTLQSEETELLSLIWGNRFIAKVITRLLTLAK